MVCIEMLNVIAYSLYARIRNSILNPYTFINSFTFTELKSRLSEETHSHDVLVFHMWEECRNVFACM